jgi:large subunit ribosomal protein L5
MNNLHKFYNEQVRPALMAKFGYKNAMAAPQIKKIAVNVGISSNIKDQEYNANVENTLVRITGQRPVKTVAKKSISSFKVREGMVVGMKVTLRGERMWDFLEKLIKITLPRVRDFRGINPKSFDQSGNYSIGFKEYISFPEIRPDEIERVHGLEVTISTTAGDQKTGLELLSNLGLPFKKEEK